MAKTAKRRTRFDARLAQIKVRLPEPLRRNLEKAASARGHSMNSEIVRRLRDSFLAQHDRARLLAEALLEGLDDSITEEMVDIVMHDRAADLLADDMREEELIERGTRGEEKS